MILATGYAAGRLLIEAVGLKSTLTRLEAAIFSIGVGLNALSLYVLAVGLAGGLRNRLIMLAPSFVLAVVAAIRMRTWWQAAAASDELADPDPPNRETQVALWLCLPLALAMLAGSLLAPWHFDSREYHMQIPKEWYQQGRIDFVPHNVYGNMPLGAEMHCLSGMNMVWTDPQWWYGAIVGKVVIAAYAVLTALLLYAFGARFLTRYAGAIAALVFISTPWIGYVSFAGLIDAVSAFYLLASCYAFLVWRDARRQESDEASGLVMLAGFLAGSSVACKYPAVVFVVLPIGIGVLSAGARRVDWKAAVLFGLAVLAACGPWFIKNQMLTGNPTYPLLAEVFGGKTRTPEKIDRWTRAHRTAHVAGQDTFGWAAMRDSAVVLLVKSDYASPLLVPLLVISLLAREHRRLLGLLAALIAVNVVAWWLLTHRVDRFLIPILPLVAILCGAGAAWSDDRWWRRVVNGLILFVWLYNVVFFVSPIISPDIRFLVSYEEIRRDIPRNPNIDRNWLHPAHRHLNEHLPPGYQAMLVGQAQVFDLEVPFLYNTCFDDCVFEQTLAGLTTDQRLATLRDKRISHVFIYWHELDRYRNSYGYSDYVTRERIQREFVDTGLFEEVSMPEVADRSQLFEVRGWRDWNDE